MLRERLTRIKNLTAARVLPSTDAITPSIVATVAAFPHSYSMGRRLVETCRSLGIVPGSGRILIVGAFGGRDYAWLRGFGYAPEILDLGHYDWGKADYVGDACSETTWERVPRGLDLVVFNDVLEHLPEDFRALRHAHAALSERGHIFASVPFRHDLEPTHLRSYSEKSFGNLLASAGFRVVWKKPRPGWLEAFPRLVNAVNYGLAVVVPGEARGASLLASLLDWEYAANDVGRSLYQRLGRSPQLGITLVCEKATAADYVGTNAATFIAESGS